MKLRALHRLGFALWLGLLALTVSGIQQNNLSRDVLAASLVGTSNDHDHTHTAGHIMPDGSFMAGDMARHEHTDPAHSGGHSHKGHADCELCGPLAAMGNFTTAALVIFALPEPRALTTYRSADHAFVVALQRAPYASRAPPSPHI